MTGLDCSGAAIVKPMRLIDELAAAHLFYPRPVPTIADVLLLDIPPAFASSSLPFGRYYPIVIETPQEREEYMAFLGADRPSVIVPDLLDRRPTSLVSSDIIFCRYEPPRPGWPWLLLCHWPAAFTRMARPAAITSREALTPPSRSLARTSLGQCNSPCLSVWAPSTP